MRLVPILVCLALAAAPAPAAADPAARPDPAEIRSRVEDLRSPFLSDRAAAVEALLQFGPAGVDALASALRDPDARVRIAAAEALGRSAAPAAVTPLLDALEQESGHVRHAIVQALVELGAPAHAALQERLAAPAGNADALDLARHALFRSTVEAELQRLILGERTILFFRGQFARIAALGRPAVDVLLEMFLQPGFPFRETSAERHLLLRRLAGEALGEMGDPEVVPVLRDLLTSATRTAELGFRAEELEDLLCTVLHALGDPEPARELARRLESHLEQRTDLQIYLQSRLADLHHRTGNHARSEELYLSLTRVSFIAGWAHGCVACIQAVQGKTDEALEHLRQAIDLGYGDPEWLRTDGELSNLRGIPEFDALVKRAEARRQPQAPNPPR